MKRQANSVRRTAKTKDAFLRLWRKQDPLKKQTVAHESDQTGPQPPPTEALMVWADDGGAVRPLDLKDHRLKKEKMSTQKHFTPVSKRWSGKPKKHLVSSLPEKSDF